MSCDECSWFHPVLFSSSSKYRIDSKDRVKLSRRGDYKFWIYKLIKIYLHIYNLTSGITWRLEGIAYPPNQTWSRQGLEPVLLLPGGSSNFWWCGGKKNTYIPVCFLKLQFVYIFIYFGDFKWLWFVKSLEVGFLDLVTFVVQSTRLYTCLNTIVFHCFSCLPTVTWNFLLLLYISSRPSLLKIIGRAPY